MYDISSSLEVINAIKTNLETGIQQDSLASLLNTTKTSSKFKNLLVSSYRYGMINKSFSQKNQLITISDLGMDYLRPKSEEMKNNTLKMFFFNSKLFKMYYESKKSSQLPKPEFGINEIMELGNLLEGMAKKTFNVFESNLKLLNLLNNDNRLVLEQSVVSSDIESHEEYTKETHTESVLSPDIVSKQKTPKIFIASGDNQKPVNIILSFLDKYNVPHCYAIDEPNEGRPISKKVSDLMDECTSAIFIFTKEDANKLENKEEYVPNVNVTYELGAASKKYEKIIIFKEKDVNFGSDFSDLGYINFDPEHMEAKISELLQELISLGFMKISVN